MVAVYPPGARYMRHVDNPDGNGRLLTALWYLNVGWRNGDGGELRLRPADGAERGTKICVGLTFLRSYEGVGAASLSCVAPCACDASSLAGLDPRARASRLLTSEVAARVGDSVRKPRPSSFTAAFDFPRRPTGDGDFLRLIDSYISTARSDLSMSPLVCR